MDGSDVAAASENRFRGKESGSRDRFAPLVAMEVLAVVNAVAFLVASITHFGIQIPLGFTTLADVTILPAGIVEGAIGLAFVLATVAIFAGQDWAWSATLGAYVFGILGVLVGLSITLRDTGDSSPANLLFHEAILPVLVVGLIVLLTKGGRQALGRAATTKEIPS